MLDLAQQEIFSRAKNPHFQGNLAQPNLIEEGANPLCGDEIHLEIELQEGIISDFKHQTRACAICTASTDLLAEYLIGKSLQSIQEIKPEQIQEFLAIPLSPTRLKCALLPLETLKQAQVQR